MTFDDLDLENNEYMTKLKRRYPIETIEGHIKRIERLGYEVHASEHSFQIYDGIHMIIDADFFDDFYLNAIHGIDGFISK